MARDKKPDSRPFPSKAEVIAFIQDSPTPVGKREIARAFQIKGGDRIPLKALLRELKQEGVLERGQRRKVRPRGHLPSVAVLEVSGVDEDGELLARPAVWDDDSAPPTIFLAPEKRSRAALAVGDRVLAKLRRIEDRVYEAQPIRKIAKLPSRVLGIYEVGEDGGRLRPTDKRAKRDYILHQHDAMGAEPGELVLAEVRQG
ncbi:MAG: ribonuclease R, partial [Alphaproteobacteria bacterium]